jgi:hypothetical protein
MKPTDKRYIVRKYIMAKSCQDALKKEHRHRPDDCYIDDAWLSAHGKDLSSAIGFTAEKNFEYYD